MPANITAKVCMVIGTPRGIGMDIRDIMIRMDVTTPMRHKSCMDNARFFIKTPFE
jgi:hypothetical protein